MNDRLPADLDAYQRQCFNSLSEFTGFQCPKGNSRCPLTAGDNAPDTLSGLRRIRHLMELAHLPQRRFSKYGVTNGEDVVVKCIDCHTEDHIDDPSASRGKRR